MKICLIKASAPGPYKKYKQQRGGPPQNIFSLASATPKGMEVELVDETAGMKIDLKTGADLVVVMMSTPDAPHGYRLADEFRRLGKTVVIGGLHATFLPEEAAEHSDALILGEAEDIWPELINDYSAGALRSVYERNTPVDLATVSPYPVGKIDPQVYKGFGSVLVSRGCPFKCSFCLVNRFFTGIRYRPVGAVVDEIKASGVEWLELHGDNLTYDREYAKELFTALKPLNIKWVGETTIRLAEDDELLALAAASGLQYLLVGVETPSKEALRDVSKGFIKPETVKDYIAKIHQYKIIIDASMLFGMDEHKKDIFSESLDFVEYAGIDVCDGIITIPFPGSRLFAKLDQEGRILTRDWAKYDGTHAVFQPAKMTPKELEEGQKWFWYHSYSLGRTLRRKYRQVKNIGAVKAAYLTFL